MRDQNVPQIAIHLVLSCITFIGLIWYFASHGILNDHKTILKFYSIEGIAFLAFNLLVYFGVNKLTVVKRMYSFTTGFIKRQLLLLLPFLFIFFIYLLMILMLAIGYKPLHLNREAMSQLLLLNLDISMLFFEVFAASLIPFIICNLGLKVFSSLKDPLLALDYASWGTLSHWSKASRRYNDQIGWITRTYLNLYRDIIGNFSLTELVAVSPSANAGTYEAKIAQNLGRDLNVPVTFIATDFADVSDHVEDFSNGNVTFKYKGGIDAVKDLPTYLQRLGITKVHLIWDIKGNMWYKANRKKAKDVFQQYYDMLETGGIIIFDAYEEKYLFRSINTALAAFGWIFRYAEHSTYSYIHKTYQNSTELQDMFEEILIEDPDHVVCNMVAFRKREK